MLTDRRRSADRTRPDRSDVRVRAGRHRAGCRSPLSKTLGAGLPGGRCRDQRGDRGGLSRTRLPVLHHPRVGSRLPAAVASTVLTVVERDGLVARADCLGRTLRGAADSTCVSDTRSGRRHPRPGLVAGYRAGCRQGRQGASRMPWGQAVTAACLDAGLHMNIVQLPGMGGIFRIAPPLTITDGELTRAWIFWMTPSARSFPPDSRKVHREWRYRRSGAVRAGRCVHLDAVSRQQPGRLSRLQRTSAPHRWLGSRAELRQFESIFLNPVWAAA